MLWLLISNWYTNIKIYTASLKSLSYGIEATLLE